MTTAYYMESIKTFNEYFLYPFDLVNRFRARRQTLCK